MAQAMQLTSSRTSIYWCGDPYNNMVFGNTSLIIREGGGYNSAGKAEPTTAGIMEFDLSGIPENRVITKLQLNIPVISISAGGETYSPAEVSGTPVVIEVWRCTKYELGNFTSLSHSDLVNMMTPFNGYSILTDKEAANIFNATSYYGGAASLTMTDLTPSASKKLYYVINRSSSYKDAFTVAFGTPTLTVAYDTIKPNPPTELNPDNTIRNKAGAIRLSWSYLDEQLGTTQSKFDVVYSTDSFATSKTITQGTSNNYCDIPANTFTDGQQVKWRVRAYNSFGDPSEYSAVAVFSVGATLPEPPGPLKPVSVVNSAEVIIFGWKYIDRYQGIQGAYTLEYKKGDVSTTVTGGGETSYSLEAGALDGGDYLWRVRTANQYGEYGGWCGWVAFYSIGQPEKPVITSITPSCQPVVAWSVAEQDAWVLQILQGDKARYSSGILPDGEENQHQVADFIPDGNYTACLKVRNVYGLWSEETRKAFTVATTPPAKPTISAQQNGESVTLTITSSAENNILYREIAGETVTIKLEGMQYTDFAVVGAYRYYVRALSGDGYADSAPVTGALYFDGITLAKKDMPENYARLRLSYGEDKRKTSSPSQDISLFRCNGRAYPVAQSSGYKSHTESHEYFVPRAAFAQLEGIQDTGGIYLVRDGGGRAFHAVMTNYSTTENEFGHLVGFTLEKVEV